VVKAKYGLIVVLVVAAGIWVTLRSSETEERRISKQLDRLADWVSKDPEEPIFATARKIRRIASLFADDCKIVTEEPSLSGAHGSEDIADRVARVRSTFTDLRLRFYDLDIAMAGRDSANAMFTGRITGRTRYQGRVDESREVACTLVRTEGEWLFARIEVVPVLER
jgi:hypothetical protein